MVDTDKTNGQEMSARELKKLRGEMWVILPFFIISIFFFLGSFRYKLETRMVPMLCGIVTGILSGMRLIHLIFPKSKIGQFKEAGLAGEFDTLKEEIEEEMLKGKYEEAPSKVITSRDEKKAFCAVIGSFLAFLLFGSLAGMFFVIIGTSYYYGYKKSGPLSISLFFMFLILYVVLYKILEGPMNFGLVLGPILKSLHIKI
jgi:hypothetical protein